MSAPTYDELRRAKDKLGAAFVTLAETKQAYQAALEAYRNAEIDAALLEENLRA